jgi:hypothetical protein
MGTYSFICAVLFCIWGIPKMFKEWAIERRRRKDILAQKALEEMRYFNNLK